MQRRKTVKGTLKEAAEEVMGAKTSDGEETKSTPCRIPHQRMHLEGGRHSGNG